MRVLILRINKLIKKPIPFTALEYSCQYQEDVEDYAREMLSTQIPFQGKYYLHPY